VLLLAANALAWLQSAQAERGIDFMALELGALKALGSQDIPGESLIFSHERLRHLLVDEAQDVNDSQVNILGLLTEGWSDGDGRTIFVVGDPKQSIYRFRRAEVSLFEDLKARGLARRGEERLRMAPRSLRGNFRSMPHLVEFSNALFERVMAKPRPEYDEASFEASSPEREGGGAPREIEVALFSYRLHRSSEEQTPTYPEARQLEASWVAKRVSQVLGEIGREAGTPGGKTVAVLVPTRTHLDVYVRAFAQVAVPLKVMEGVAMLDRPEVRALHSLMVALLRPHDDLAWAEALRAPWCGASNADLARLAALPAASWGDRILSQKEADGGVGAFGRAIEPFLGTFGRGDLSQSLLALWEELDGPSAFARRWGKSAVANALAYIGLLAKAGVGEEAIESVERKLGAAYTPPDPAAAFSSVSLMTIHKAKGLEFDFVFAAGLDYLPKRGRENDGQPFIMGRVPGRERLELAAVCADRRTGEKTLGFQLLQELEFKRSLAEHKRLMYVAATRAREGLALSALRPRKKEESGGGNSRGMADWLYEAFEECVFENIPARLLEDPEIAAAEGAQAPTKLLVLEAPPFEPQRLPYTIHSPSGLREIDDETALPSAYPEKVPEPWARARGLVMHRLFESLALGRPLPSPDGVAAAFLKEGLGVDEARRGAATALAEALSAWKCEPFARLREGAECLPEYGLEVAETSERILAGRLDLLVKTRDGAVVVDYKTGAPVGNVEEWMNREASAYAPQLEAYRRMAAAHLGLDEADVRSALLFTAVPALKWMTDER
jgi:ATP-dependent exoDNAse (exonuclease V) beta subunit